MNKVKLLKLQPPLDPLACALVAVFNQTFAKLRNTELIMAAQEPLYLPADKNQSKNQIYFTRDYPASALHEIAHWCLAGSARRKLVDYGYWYEPDGRDAKLQQEFEKVEIKPQAIELLLSMACGQKFRPSADNLAQGLGASAHFKQAIHQQAQQYFIAQNLPRDAKIFFKILCEHFKNHITLAQIAAYNL